MHLCIEKKIRTPRIELGTNGIQRLLQSIALPTELYPDTKTLWLSKYKHLNRGTKQLNPHRSAGYLLKKLALSVASSGLDCMLFHQWLFGLKLKLPQPGGALG